MSRDNAPLHVIFGAGQIGSRLASVLAARGLRVRVVRRGSAPVALTPVALPPEAVAPGAAARVESVSGDASDQAFAARAAAGAAVIYDCMNPPYHRWPELLLPMARGPLHAAASAGARLVALDCLYMYGRPEGPLREDSPLAPCSKKGALRVALAELRLEAHRRGDARVTIGRASDFFGADLPFSFWGDRFYARVLAGKPAECLGDPDMPHAYTYVDDVARALATLGERDEALGRVWHLPTNRAESTRALVARLGRALGVRAEVARVPRLALRAIGLFSPFVREAVEMAYQWEAPFELDDARFRAAFGYGPTPIDEAVAQ
ncbi:MAG TPA: NAD-dependent epimerase/dehydratase family protein, partial [Polyangiaceae bacterium]|nr:NAD-dependent epimerase/dehydratase family protein [Polyangiaceae bacterium]